MAAAQDTARTILDARRGRRLLDPLSAGDPAFSVDAAYVAAAQLRLLREAGGETPVGRKIGFTNRGIWPEYGVYAPIWGEVYDSTVIDIAPGDTIDISQLSQPRLEPEIVLGIDRDLHAGMSVAEIESAIAWVAHGYEIVQTVFRDWKFTVADCIADGALHGLMLLGPRQAVAAADRAGLSDRLAGVGLELSCDGVAMGQGTGANALDGPVQALKFMVDGIAAQPACLPLRAGELVTTGTLTRAFAIAPGERWTTRLTNSTLPRLDVTFR